MLDPSPIDLSSVVESAPYYWGIIARYVVHGCCERQPSRFLKTLAGATTSSFRRAVRWMTALAASRGVDPSS
jgi:hypothetical protein